MWLLDYDEILLLHLEDENSFLRSPLYKLSLKRYIQEVSSCIVSFRSTLTYLDYKKIILICEKECRKKGISFSVSPTLHQYIEDKEMHIEIRSRLGIELKNHDNKLMDRFSEYQAITDACMARKLRERQMWDSFFMCTMKKSANFSVPGSGKTASVLGMYAYLHHKRSVKRILVICPKNAFGSWMDEFEVCFLGIESPRVMNIHAPQYKSVKQRQLALQYDSGGCNLILVNYEAVGGVLEQLKALIDHETLLVFDEVHKVKRIEGEYARGALTLAQDANYVVAMTGTPIPNSYMDVYNLLHILFPSEYDEFFGFTIPSLRQPGATEIHEINDKIQPFFCRTTKDQLGVPAVNQDALIAFPSTEREERLLDILKMKYRKNKLALLIRILQMESDPKMLLQSLDLRDFQYLLDDSAEIDEIDFADYSTEVKALIENCETTSKFDQCISLAESLTAQGKPIIVWCMFVSSIRRLADMLESHGVRCRCIYGEVSLEERQEILSDFRSGKIQVLLTNPHTLAESVSLHSVCHDAIYFEYSYNLVHLLQSKDRIHRLGLQDGQYTQYYYMQQFYQSDDGEWSLDRAIYDRLKEKEQTMLDAIDRHVLETLPTSDEDLDLIFSSLL